MRKKWKGRELKENQRRNYLKDWGKSRQKIIKQGIIVGLKINSFLLGAFDFIDQRDFN